MKPYIALDTVVISCGNVQVSGTQFRRRKHCLSVNSDGSYTVNKPIQFKQGESFLSDITVNKALALLLTTPQEDVDEIVSRESVNEVIADQEAQETDEEQYYSEYSKDDLRRELTHRGIDFKKGDSKAKIIEMLEADDLNDASD
jgi:hypothetical protein